MRILMPSDMERWRSFFAQAEADLWTIICQAILIAAADFPAEFMCKRCEIAEVLFARRQCPSPPTRSKEATMLSGSVITSAISDGEKKGPHQTCREGDDIRYTHASRLEVKVADAESLGTASKLSAAERHILHSDKSVELDTRLWNCNDPRDFHENAHDLATDHSILQNVSMIKDQIMDSANQSEDGLLKFLRALDHLDINVEILKATDIGREVNKFRKHPSGPVRNLVKQLVRNWKSMVDEWVRYAAIVDPLNASGEQEIVNEDVRHVNLLMEASAQRPLQLSKSLIKSTGDSTSTLRRQLQTEQAVEEMGSSRVEADEFYRPGFMERKSNSCAQQVQNSRCIVVKRNTGGLGPGRPLTSTLDAERVFVNKNVACDHHKHVEEESRSVQGGGLQRNGHGKIMIDQNLSAAEHVRLETMKRRLPLEDQHVERAKKQRDMPPSSSLELSKRGLLSARLPACAKSQHSIQKR